MNAVDHIMPIIHICVRQYTYLFSVQILESSAQAEVLLTKGSLSSFESFSKILKKKGKKDIKKGKQRHLHGYLDMGCQLTFVQAGYDLKCIDNC